MTPPLVALYWDDAHGSNPRWEEEIEVGQGPDEPAPIVTIGWIMSHTDVGINIACEQTDATHYRGSTFVPEDNIVAIKTLRKGSLWKRPRTVAPPGERSSKKRTGPSAPPDTVHRDPAVGETDE